MIFLLRLFISLQKFHITTPIISIFSYDLVYTHIYISCFKEAVVLFLANILKLVWLHARMCLTVTIAVKVAF